LRTKVYAHGTVTEQQQKIGREGIDREKIQPGGKLTVLRHSYIGQMLTWTVCIHVYTLAGQIGLPGHMLTGDWTDGQQKCCIQTFEHWLNT